MGTNSLVGDMKTTQDLIHYDVTKMQDINTKAMIIQMER